MARLSGEAVGLPEKASLALWSQAWQASWCNVQADCVGFRTSSQAFLVALSVLKISLKSLIEI